MSENGGEEDPNQPKSFEKASVVRRLDDYIDNRTETVPPEVSGQPKPGKVSLHPAYLRGLTSRLIARADGMSDEDIFDFKPPSE